MVRLIQFIQIEFENALIKKLCTALGMIKSKSALYCTAENSMTERLFRTVKDILYATAHSTGKTWTVVLPLIRETYDVHKTSRHRVYLL